MLGEATQARAHEDAVLADHRHDVARRRDGYEVEVGPRLLVGPPEHAQHGLDELEAHATARQPVEGIVAVGPLGVQHSDGLGQDRPGRVVVADDEVEPARARVRGLLDGRDAAVDGDHEARPSLDGDVEACGTEAVAVLEAVRDEEACVDALRREERQQHRRRGRPVDVVVAVDEHALAGADGPHDALGRGVHVAHPERVVQE